MQKGDKIENARTGQRMICLKTAAETKGALLQIECFSPVTTAKEAEHIHPLQENRFEIISGEVCFSINGQEKKAVAGDVVSIPKNTPHHFWNTGTTEAHYIQEFIPALKIDEFFETFFALARDGQLNDKGVPNIFRTSLVLMAYKNEIRLVKPSWAVQKIVFSVFALIGKMLGYKSYYK